MSDQHYAKYVEYVTLLLKEQKLPKDDKAKS